MECKYLCVHDLPALLSLGLRGLGLRGNRKKAGEKGDIREQRKDGKGNLIKVIKTNSDYMSLLRKSVSRTT